MDTSPPINPPNVKTYACPKIDQHGKVWLVANWQETWSTAPIGIINNTK